MTRPRDEPILEGESLFRAVPEAHVTGRVILPEAIDMPRCSFDREKYGSSAGVLKPQFPESNRIAVLVSGDHPRGELTADGASVSYILDIVDDPLDDNDAHCEVRARRSTDPAWTNSHKMGRTSKALAKARLAATMKALPVDSSG